MESKRTFNIPLLAVLALLATPKQALSSPIDDCGPPESFGDFRSEYRLCLQASMAANSDVNCWDCLTENYQQEAPNPWLEALGIIAGPLALFGSTYMQAKYQYKGQAAWANAHLGSNQAAANAYRSGYDACQQNFDSYMRYASSRQSFDIMGQDGASLLAQCNGHSLFGNYAGFSGLSSFPLGPGNPFMSNGYTNGFMAGMIGPNFNGGAFLGAPGAGAMASGSIQVNPLLAAGLLGLGGVLNGSMPALQFQAGAGAFAGAGLTGSPFGGASLYGSPFAGAQFQAGLTGSPFAGSLYGSPLAAGLQFQTGLTGSPFGGASLYGSPFAGAQFQAGITGSPFGGASLYGSPFAGAQFQAGITGSPFGGASLYGSPFAGAQFQAGAGSLYGSPYSGYDPYYSASAGLGAEYYNNGLYNYPPPWDASGAWSSYNGDYYSQQNSWLEERRRLEDERRQEAENRRREWRERQEQIRREREELALINRDLRASHANAQSALVEDLRNAQQNLHFNSRFQRSYSVW